MRVQQMQSPKQAKLDYTTSSTMTIDLSCGLHSTYSDKHFKMAQ